MPIFMIDALLSFSMFQFLCFQIYCGYQIRRHSQRKIDSSEYLTALRTVRSGWFELLFMFVMIILFFRKYVRHEYDALIAGVCIAFIVSRFLVWIAPQNASLRAFAFVLSFFPLLVLAGLDTVVSLSIGSTFETPF